ncbi:hypothetical protein [Streptomyces sp. NPDC001137]|uniref:DUF7919 family protein n=1 Tax=Streptomyces sp. NPDC001137 TaxID=3154378 RepID=UPI0033219038
MADYEDMSVYSDGYSPFEILNVGWLGASCGVPVDGTPVSGRLVGRLVAESRKPRSLTLGTHDCEFCDGEGGRGGNGEIHLYSTVNSAVFSAPLLVLHYVKRHGYSPPSDFLKSLASADEPLDWDSRAETLVSILSDPAGDAGWRVNALFELPRWGSDERAYRTVADSVNDEEIRETAEYELGVSLSQFWIAAGGVDTVVYSRLSPATRHVVAEEFSRHSERLTE